MSGTPPDLAPNPSEPDVDFYALAQLSEMIDEGLWNRGLGGSAMLPHRVGKIAEELGEAWEALTLFTGANFRKAPTGTLDELVAELYDVAATALGAVFHATGDNPFDGLRAHVRELYGRALWERDAGGATPRKPPSPGEVAAAGGEAFYALDVADTKPETTFSGQVEP